jgi:hypothetical protein
MHRIPEYKSNKHKTYVRENGVNIVIIRIPLLLIIIMIK